MDGVHAGGSAAPGGLTAAGGHGLAQTPRRPHDRTAPAAPGLGRTLVPATLPLPVAASSADARSVGANPPDAPGGHRHAAGSDGRRTSANRRARARPLVEPPEDAGPDPVPRALSHPQYRE